MKITTGLFVLSVLACSLYYFMGNVADPDLWGHMTYAEDAWAQGRLLDKADHYSFTADGSFWTNHEWLSELFFYFAFAAGGAPALLLFKFFIGLMTSSLVLVSVMKQTQSQFLRLLFTLLPISAMGYGFMTRPQIFTIWLFTALIFLIDRYLRTSDLRWVMGLPLLMVFWTNNHGGFIVGLGVICFLAGLAVLSGKHRVPLIAIAAASVLITLINPYGPGLWMFLLESLTKDRPHLPEWQHAGLASRHRDYIALLILVSGSLLVTKTKRRWFDLVVLIGLALVSMRQVRHTVLFASAAGVLGAQYLDSAVGAWCVDLEKRLTNGFFIVLSVVIVGWFSLKTYVDGEGKPLEILIPPDRYPVGAVAFMEANGIHGNLFTFFDWAQYCIREFRPHTKLFFDGRFRTVYEDAFITQYFDVLYGKVPWKSVLGNYEETDIMLLHQGNELSGILEQDPEWVLVYASDLSRVFLKRNERNQELIQRHEQGTLRQPVVQPPVLFH